MPLATTKIWPVRDSLRRVVDYAANPDKTEYSGLAQALHYAENDAKTTLQETAQLVSGVHCRPGTAWTEMRAVQEQFGKTEGVVAMHAYQSFKPGEVTPEQCHAIGVELARRVWGGRFQVLVATHLNTDCLHNHFVINAVSYHIEYGLLNTKYFGPPQNRERVFIVACRHPGAGRGPKIFPVPAGSGKALIQLIGGMQGQRVYDPAGISVTMAAQSGGWGGKTGLYFVDLCNGNPKLTDHARCIKAKYNSGITNRGGDNSGVFYGCRAVVTPDRAEKRQNGRRIKECGEPAFTLTAQDRHGVAFQDCEKCPYEIPVFHKALSECGSLEVRPVAICVPQEIQEYCMELFGEDVQIAAASYDLFAKRANGQIYRPLVEKYIAGEKRL